MAKRNADRWQVSAVRGKTMTDMPQGESKLKIYIAILQKCISDVQIRVGDLDPGLGKIRIFLVTS
jgi:hypothetical protein